MHVTGFPAGMFQTNCHDRLSTSLADRLLVLDDDTIVLPGHGATSTIGRERASNPHLVGLGSPNSGQ